MIDKDLEEFKDSKLYKPVFDQAPIGVLIVNWTDDKGRIIDCNNEVTEILGYTKKQILKMKFQEFTHIDDLDTDVDMTTQEKPFGMIKRYLRKDYQIVWVKLTAIPVRDEDENFLFFVSWVEELKHSSDVEIQKTSKGEIQVRPQVKLGGFLQDNWRPIMVLSLVLLGIVEKEQVVSLLTKIFL